MKQWFSDIAQEAAQSSDSCKREKNEVSSAYWARREDPNLVQHSPWATGIEYGVQEGKKG